LIEIRLVERYFEFIISVYPKCKLVICKKRNELLREKKKRVKVGGG